MTVLKLAEKLAKPSHFLIVDDEASVCSVLAFGLARLGCTSRVANDGASALRALAEDQFSGVLLDIRMVGMTGFEVIKEMRRLDINVPVLIITGFPDDDVYRLIDSYGALAVIVKPITLEDLVTLLKRYFSIFNVRHHQHHQQHLQQLA